ncbi:DUF6309 family protein [Streptomyces sp. NPDC091377]|uniref:DUF6309 family protein n=1 Tax=unclassified Streptomyces TaxID=2593676 RepID=UPI0037FB88AF
MRVIGSVPSDAVVREFLRDHPYDPDERDNTNDDAESNLHAADRLLGHWYRVLLDRSELLEVILPWHLGEGGGIELVPPTGLTLADASAALRALGDTYALSNPHCAHKLNWQATAPLGPIHLSTRAVPGADYERMEPREGLIHLDGLHRMLAWENAGRLHGGVRIEALVAADASWPTTLNAGQDSGRNTAGRIHGEAR